MRLIGDIMPKAKKKRRKKTNKAAKDTTNKKNFVMVHEEKSTFHDKKLNRYLDLNFKFKKYSKIELL